MLTPKFKKFAAVFQRGPVAVFVEYARDGRLEDWERLYKKAERYGGRLLHDYNEVDIDAIVGEIEDRLIRKLPKDECEPCLFDIITALKLWARGVDGPEGRTARPDGVGAAFAFRAQGADGPERAALMEAYIRGWAALFGSFVLSFQTMLLKHGIDMMRLQEECGVYLNGELLPSTVGIKLGSMKLAHKYIGEMQAKREPQQEETKPILIDDTEILMKVFTEWNGEIWANIDVLDFVAMMQTGDLAKLEIKQRTKMRKILAGIRMEITDEEKSNQWCKNVKNTTDIDAKRATPNVTREEIANSSGMKDFGRRLSRIFATKAK